MAYTHTRLVYNSQLAGFNYIDLTRGLSLMNAKNCTQFTAKDKPKLITATVRLDSGTETLSVAKNSWVVRNACVKAAAAWRRTLRSAGIRRKSQLNTYARTLRLAMDEDHSDTWCSLDSAGGFADLIPVGADVSYDTGQYNSAGDEIVVLAYNADTSLVPWGAKNKQAFTQTTFAVPQSGSTDVLDKPANLLGGIDATDSNVVAEYIDSRINDANIEDTDMDETPSIDNDFVMMLAPGEEVADDVLDNIDDEGRWRPYSLATHTSAVMSVVPGNNIAGQDTLIEAPLGLIVWKASGIGSTIVIDVLLEDEM